MTLIELLSDLKVTQSYCKRSQMGFFVHSSWEDFNFGLHIASRFFLRQLNLLDWAITPRSGRRNDNHHKWACLGLCDPLNSRK